MPNPNLVQIELPPAAFTRMGVMFMDVLHEYLDVALFFNRYPGETNEQAARRVHNMAPGAPKAPSDRTWPGAGGVATFSPDYATFRNDQPFATRMADLPVGGGSYLFLGRSRGNPTLGDTATDRATFAGTYGTAGTGGFGVEALSKTTMRATDYPVGEGSSAQNVQSVLAEDSMDKWRLWLGRCGPNVHIRNLQGDGTSPNPGQVAMTGGSRRVGTQSLWIGGRQVPVGATNYNPAITKDIGWFFRFRTPITVAGDLTALIAQNARLLTETQGPLALMSNAA